MCRDSVLSAESCRSILSEGGGRVGAKNQPTRSVTVRYRKLCPRAGFQWISGGREATQDSALSGQHSERRPDQDSLVSIEVGAGVADRFEQALPVALQERWESVAADATL